MLWGEPGRRRVWGLGFAFSLKLVTTSQPVGRIWPSLRLGLGFAFGFCLWKLVKTWSLHAVEDPGLCCVGVWVLLFAKVGKNWPSLRFGFGFFLSQSGEGLSRSLF